MITNEVRTRFAPSPTGFMHVGGTRTALFAWLVAKQAGGEFLLRFEDTDRKRHVPEAEGHILETLKWLGLQWAGDAYRQSEHLDVYKVWAQKLIDKGRAYADNRSEEDLNKLRAEAKAQKKPFLYRNYRPDILPSWGASQPLRLKSDPKPYRWHDEVMGDLSTGPEVIDDFVLIKSDGYPTYDFAHIVDDHLMGITHVTRSNEFAASIPKFLNLYEALDIKRPKLATLPVVLAPDGRKKLSKRDGAKDVLDYRNQGFLAETLINFLATLGWNDGTEQEIFSVDELIKKFSLDRVQKSGARFDERRLLWMNGQYIDELSADELNKNAADFLPSEAKDATENYKNQVLSLVRERLKNFAELPELTWFFFREPTVKEIESELIPEGKVVDMDGKKFEVLRGNKANLVHIEAVLKSLSESDFSESDIQDRLNKLLGSLDTVPAVLFSEIRGAVSGSRVSPQLFGTLHVLGKQRTLDRLQKAIDSLAKAA